MSSMKIFKKIKVNKNHGNCFLRNEKEGNGV